MVSRNVQILEYQFPISSDQYKIMNTSNLNTWYTCILVMTFILDINYVSLA